MNFIRKFQRKTGHGAHLIERNPNFTAGFEKSDVEGILDRNIERLVENQYKLYADNTPSLMIIFQGRDNSGKDGAIRHIMSGINHPG